MEKGGGEFLNIKYPDLQKSDQVQKSVDKKVRIEHIVYLYQWLDFLFVIN